MPDDKPVLPEPAPDVDPDDGADDRPPPSSTVDDPARQPEKAPAPEPAPDVLPADAVEDALAVVEEATEIVDGQKIPAQQRKFVLDQLNAVRGILDGLQKRIEAGEEIDGKDLTAAELEALQPSDPEKAGLFLRALRSLDALIDPPADGAAGG